MDTPDVTNPYPNPAPEPGLYPPPAAAASPQPAPGAYPPDNAART